MDVPASVAHIAAGNRNVSCPLCGNVPLDSDNSCPAGYCGNFGLNVTSPEAQKQAARYRAGDRPWREQ